MWSTLIQKRYFLAVDRRRKNEVKEEYLLVEFGQKQVNEAKTPVNVSKNSVNADNNTQSKVKESKVNESRVESARTGLQSAPELYAALCSKYGRTFVDERVERSKQYKGANMQTVASGAKRILERNLHARGMDFVISKREIMTMQKCRNSYFKKA